MWNLKKQKQKTKLINKENRLVVVRGRGQRVSKIGEGDPKAQTSSYKISKSWGYNVQHGDNN